MNSIKGVSLVVVCLWAAVVVTYATSVQPDYFLHKDYKMSVMMSSSCSSSTSSGNPE